ncbi:hypothetical protein PWT90_08402 [Aphanocladium album]|nr:hypothetical protein PWT90_08402 [Aphanocladium album]
MELLDPATGKALPSDAIQRVLFIANKVYVYNIPPLTSMRGHNAASWTADPSRQIFAARIRVVETSYESISSSSPSSSSSSSSSQQQLKVDVVLEDPSTGQLFAASPYTDAAAVEPAVDSSRFFALTVRDEAGRKAVLGVGFEERPEAFDFSIALQEARKALGWEVAGGGEASRSRSAAEKPAAAATPAKDYSLKEGETITINIGNKFGRRRPQAEPSSSAFGVAPSASLQSFALAPPPPPAAASRSEESSSAEAGSSSGGGFALPPPPRAQDVKSKRKSLMEMGFDDGQFGEFA